MNKQEMIAKVWDAIASLQEAKIGTGAAEARRAARNKANEILKGLPANWISKLAAETEMWAALGEVA